MFSNNPDVAKTQRYQLYLNWMQTMLDTAPDNAPFQKEIADTTNWMSRDVSAEALTETISEELKMEFVMSILHHTLIQNESLIHVRPLIEQAFAFLQLASLMQQTDGEKPDEIQAHVTELLPLTLAAELLKCIGSLHDPTTPVFQKIVNDVQQGLDVLSTTQSTE